ncbi:MAG: PAS domain S-box protein, partial [Gammaproteobacteria bacterium]|nr:PAS domain S-box protein [Gammaproteobacteria bacterium]
QARLLEKIGVELLEQEREEQSGLREDNARLQDRLCLALEGSSLGIWEYDHQLDRLSWSRSLCELLGYSENEAPAGMDEWLNLVHPEDRNALQGVIESGKTPGSPAYEAEYRLRKTDGAWCWIHARGRVIRWTRTGDPLATAGTMADISTRKQSETLLLAQQTLWQALAGEPDKASLWKAILDSALLLPGLDCGAVYEVTTETCTMLAQRGLSPGFQDRSESLDAIPPLAAAIRSGRLTCTGAHETETGPIDQPNLQDEGFQAIAVLPIRVGDRAVAGLYLASRHSPYLDPGTRDGLNRLLGPFTQALQRFQAQEEARHQRQNIAGLFDAMADFVFVIGMDGMILHYNEAVAKRLAPETGLVGIPIWQVHPADLQAEAKHLLTDILGGQRSTCSLPLVTLDGQRLAVDTRVVSGQWDGRPVLLGISRDVTELAGQRDAASRSEILLRTTLDSTADGLLVISEDGQPLVMNRRFRELWQVPEPLAATGTEEPLLRHVRDQLVDPDAFLREVQRLYRCEDEQTDYLNFKDGRVFERFTRPIRLGAQRARLWSFRDMTERARARRAVEYERARLRVLIRTI